MLLVDSVPRRSVALFRAAAVGGTAHARCGYDNSVASPTEVDPLGGHGNNRAVSRVSELTERRIAVASKPFVELSVAMRPGEKASTLLVVHGGPDWDHTYLREPLVQLAPGRRVVFVDLRGCGRSTRGLPTGSYTPDEVVRDLVALIERLGPTPADVLGFSYGGLLAQRLATTAPNMIRRLIIASSSVLPVPPDAFAGWTERDVRLASCPRLEGYDDGRWDPERTRRDAVNTALVNVWRREAIPGYLARIGQIRFSADWAQTRLAGKLPPARPEGAIEKLVAIGKPILLLHGQHDMIFPAELVKHGADRVPTARCVVLTEAGHMAHIDQPSPWLTAIAEFLEGRETPPDPPRS